MIICTCSDYTAVDFERFVDTLDVDEIVDVSADAMVDATDVIEDEVGEMGEDESKVDVFEEIVDRMEVVMHMKFEGN